MDGIFVLPLSPDDFCGRLFSLAPVDTGARRRHVSLSFLRASYASAVVEEHHRYSVLPHSLFDNG